MVVDGNRSVQRCDQQPHLITILPTLANISTAITNASGCTRSSLLYMLPSIMLESCSFVKQVVAQQGHRRSLTRPYRKLSAKPCARVLPALGSLANLELLYLSSNQLSGIPPELGSLDLSRNQLSQNITPELGNLASLTGLTLRVRRVFRAPARWCAARRRGACE